MGREKFQSGTQDGRAILSMDSVPDIERRWEATSSTIESEQKLVSVILLELRAIAVSEQTSWNWSA
jgi:hypothetical protein